MRIEARLKRIEEKMGVNVERNPLCLIIHAPGGPHEGFEEKFRELYAEAKRKGTPCLVIDEPATGLEPLDQTKSNETELVEGNHG